MCICNPLYGITCAFHGEQARAAMAGRPILDEATARAAGWLPLNEVLAALRDDEGMWEWAEQFGDSRDACVVSHGNRLLVALYLAGHFTPAEPEGIPDA